MGILDDAIKEHLELKRQHGAGESELKKLEDEAFGESERPGSEGSASDPLAEAPTQFMTQPDLETADEASGQAEGEASSTEVETAASSPEAEEPTSRGRTEIADLQEPPVESIESADEEAPAMEHETVSEPAAEESDSAEEPRVEASAGPSTEERHAISEHPTELYDVEAELGDAEPSDAEPEVHVLPDEQALSEEDEEFWDEKRLSDELDEALEAPIELREPEITRSSPEPEAVAEPELEEPDGDQGPAEEPPESRSGSEDVLDETPDFLEEKPEDDQLWFEQKPPKDFDFDD